MPPGSMPPGSVPPGGGPPSPFGPPAGSPGGPGGPGGPGANQGFGDILGAGRPQPVRAAGRPAEEEWDDYEEDPGPSYTWLHYIILVVVAFVLGLLIWRLLLGSDPAASDGASAATTFLGALSGWGAS